MLLSFSCLDYLSELGNLLVRGVDIRMRATVVQQQIASCANATMAAPVWSGDFGVVGGQRRDGLALTEQLVLEISTNIERLIRSAG